MNTDQRNPGTDNAAGRGTRDSAWGPPMGIRQAFREIRRGIVVMWWGFFDWVAVVQWKALSVRQPNLAPIIADHRPVSRVGVA